jgi:hypothetical protein
MSRSILKPLVVLPAFTNTAYMSSSAPVAGPSGIPHPPYEPRHSSWPYSPADFKQHDPSPDTFFYASPRLVTHIDEHAIAQLGQYYLSVLPRSGRILDLCSSWISHFPPVLEALAQPCLSSSASTFTSSHEDMDNGDTAPVEPIQVIGMGMNETELSHNPILARRIVHDLNANPTLPPDLGPLVAVTCVVSIDYLTQPLQVLQSTLQQMQSGATIHLVISNRCFPTKAIARWLEVDEEEHLQMVGDYLHFAGFGDIQIVTICDGRSSSGYRVDPLWVVRGSRTTYVEKRLRGVIGDQVCL